MEKHENGSVTLSKSEFAELNKAYQGLYTILSQMPSSFGDYFERRTLTSIYRWHAQLQGNKFVRSDWFE